MALKIAMVVHGRFHAFDLGTSLLRRGHDVRLFTDYPGWAVARFGFPRERVTSLTSHGIAVRVLDRLGRWGLRPDLVAFLHRWFGRWAARRVAREHWDVVYVWSSVAEEVLTACAGKVGQRWLVRESSHIRHQHQLLQEEEQRTGIAQDKPHPWSIARELREYQLADRIVATSTFSRNSFIANGFDPVRMLLLRAAVRSDLFQATPEQLLERYERIQRGLPLRILYVGTLCFRKGLFDLVAAIRQLDPARFSFEFVGNALAEVESSLASIRDRATFTGRLPESELVRHYADSDVFVIPTIEDGGPFVLVQALAAGLLCVASPNCLAPDLIRDGDNGFLRPIRDPTSLVNLLNELERDRGRLAAIILRVAQGTRTRSWDDAAIEFEEAARRAE